MPVSGSRKAHPSVLQPAVAASERAALEPLLATLLEPKLGYVARHWPEELYRKLASLAADAGQTPLSWLLRLSQTHPKSRAVHDIERLVEAATVSHTTFFRHPEQFASLSRLLTARESGLRRPLRIWSAACATGQEPYSVALCAHQLGIPVEVLATDVNPRCIQFAARGRYDARHTRGLSGELAGKPWTVPAALRTRVRFQVASLVERASLPRQGTFDIVLCRNVLLYFQAARASQVLHLLAESLSENGVLIVAPAEVLIPLPDNLMRGETPGFFTRKSLRREEPPGRARVGAGTAEGESRPATATVPRARARRRRTTDRLEQAARDIAGGQLDAAEATLRAHLDAVPTDPCGWFLLAETLVQRDELAQARVAFEQAAAHAERVSGEDADPDTLRQAATRRAMHCAQMTR